MSKRLVIPIILMIAAAAAACGILVYTKNNSGFQGPGMATQQGSPPGGQNATGENSDQSGASTDQNGQGGQTAPSGQMPSGNPPEMSSGTPPEKPSGTPPEKPSDQNGNNGSGSTDNQMPAGQNNTGGGFGGGPGNPGHVSANIPTILSLGACAVVFAFALMYLVLSRLGKERVWTDKKKKLILCLGTIGLGVIITVCLALIVTLLL